MSRHLSYIREVRLEINLNAMILVMRAVFEVCRFATEDTCTEDGRTWTNRIGKYTCE